MKHSRIAAALCLLLAVVTAAGCASGGADTTAAQITETTETAEAATTAEEVTEPESVTTEETPEDPGELVIWQPGEKRCAFSVVYDKKSDEDVTAAADMLAAMIRNYTGAEVKTANSTTSAKREIVFSSKRRSETASMLGALNDGEYAVRVLPGEAEGEGKLLIATTTYCSAYTCAEYLLESFYTEENGFRVPLDLDVTGTEKPLRLTDSTINKKLRDPCILVEDGVYYAYGTGWKCFKNTSGKLDGPFKKVEIEVTLAHPDTDGGSHWAPEVHKYNGSYYMFTTYLNSKTNRRGCIILKADSPEGPFVEITDGHVTPAGWDAIDGTFYVDPDGQPWMVFVHEWTSMPGNIGAFAAAKLSDDLTHFISEPIELFKANEPVWAKANITDGCFMYTTEQGELLMLWSNFDEFGYSVAVARSSNGRLDGEWTHEKGLLYSKYMTNVYDGGHAMVFRDTDGVMYITFHSPNTATDDRKETAVFMAIEEKDGRLRPMKAE